jgi:hypothetical protein
LVLTETDYLRFLINLSKEGELLPAQINIALNDTSLLFIGYNLTDINFRSTIQGIMYLLKQRIGSLPLPRIAVIPPVGFIQGKKEQAINYLNQFRGTSSGLRIYWGDPNEFAAELRDRWVKFKGL